MAKIEEKEKLSNLNFVGIPKPQPGEMERFYFLLEFDRRTQAELKKVGSTGTMHSEHPRLIPGTNATRTHLKDA